MRILLITALALILPYFSKGQLTVSGSVTDAVSKDPIAGCNVFISNTSFATVTDKEGHFILPNLPIQKGELIVNALGYNHSVYNVFAGNAAGIRLSLEPRSRELAEVTVGAYEKDGYSHWGKLYTDLLLGTTPEARDCRIMNPGVLRFRYTKSTGILEVSAVGPLLIRNPALGYYIYYTAEDFTYDTKNHILTFAGYPSFKEMGGTPKQLAKHRAARNNCYRGSVLHFMRSVYRNKLSEEGFTVFPARKVAYREKERVKKIMYNYTGTEVSLKNTNDLAEDSLRYYNKILMQEDSLFTVFSQPLAADSFAFAVDSITAGMYFEKHIAVRYKLSDSLATVFKLKPRPATYSYARLLSPEVLEIYRNGSIYNTMNFFTEQYWGFTERMSRTLPFDFIYREPPQQ